MDKETRVLIEKIDEIMDNFDFEKVHKVMKFLGWKWANLEPIGSESVPDVPTLRKEVRNNLYRLYDEYKTEKNSFIATGGFEYEIIKDDEEEYVFIVKFVLEEFNFY